MTNNRKFFSGLLVSACLLLQGCSPSDKELWGLGSLVFFVFVAIFILNNIAPRIQEVPAFQSLVSSVEVFAEKCFPWIVAGAIASVCYGLYSVIVNEDRSRQGLFLFVGAVLLYMATSLRVWSREKDVLKKRNAARAIGLSLSFLMIYAYLLLGAPNLRI